MFGGMQRGNEHCPASDQQRDANVIKKVPEVTWDSHGPIWA